MSDQVSGAVSALIVVALLAPWSARSEAFLGLDLPSRWSAVPPVAFFLLGIVLSSPLLLVVTPLAWVLVAGRLSVRERRRREVLTAESIPTTIDSLVLRLNSGASLQSSIELAFAGNNTIGGAEEVKEALVAVEAGERIDKALERASAATTHEWLRLLSSSVTVLTATGGPRGPALERLAEILRVNHCALRESAAQSAQAQASAAVLGVLPLVFASMVALASSDARTFYASTWLGAICLGSSIVLTWICWIIFDQVLSRGDL